MQQGGRHSSSALHPSAATGAGLWVPLGTALTITASPQCLSVCVAEDSMPDSPPCRGRALFQPSHKSDTEEISQHN